MLDFSALPASLARLAASPAWVLLVALLVVAAVIDARTYRIPNWLTFGGMAVGLLCNALWPVPAATGWWALAGLAVGFGCTLPFHLLGVMGAGDVKLMATVGAFVGFPDIFGALLYTFIAGGLGAIAFAIRRRALRRMTVNVAHVTQNMLFSAMTGLRGATAMPAGLSVGKLPYGLAICAGTLAWLAVSYLR